MQQISYQGKFQFTEIWMLVKNKNRKLNISMQDINDNDVMTIIQTIDF